MSSKKTSSSNLTRRNFVKTAGIVAAGGVALGAGLKAAPSQAQEGTEKEATTVALDWKEVYYTNCPLVSASNVDQELGWTKEEYS